jgi:hypothetical protein
MTDRLARERVTLFDRVALCVGGAVVGYPSGLALGLMAFWLACLFGLVRLDTGSGHYFLYDLPIGVSVMSALGAVLTPRWTADVIAKLWHLVVALLQVMGSGS